MIHARTGLQLTSSDPAFVKRPFFLDAEVCGLGTYALMLPGSYARKPVGATLGNDVNLRDRPLHSPVTFNIFGP